MVMILLQIFLQDPAALVERLRSEDPAVRMRAEADLTKLGEAAETALDAAAKDADPEVAARAKRLLAEGVASHRQEVRREALHVGRHMGTAMMAGSTPVLEGLKAAFAELDPENMLARTVTPLDLSLLSRDLKYPRRSAWPGIREKVRARMEKTVFDRACKACVERRLETLKVGLKFENAKVEEILAYLREVGGVNLILDAGMSDDPRERQMELAVTIEAKDVALAEALKRLLAPYGMGCRVTEEGVVLLGRSAD